LDVIEAGLSVKPQAERLIFQRGLLRSLLGQFDDAAADFEQASQLAPESQLPYAGLGLAAIQRSQLPEAITMLRERRKKQKDAELDYLLGWALVRSGAAAGTSELQEAESAFESGVRLNPKLPYPYIELGKIYLKTGRAEQAIALLEKGLELAPQERAAYSHLVTAYRRTGQPEKATKMMEALLRLSEEERNRAAAAIRGANAAGGC